jgi:hypothetical protein
MAFRAFDGMEIGDVEGEGEIVNKGMQGGIEDMSHYAIR